MAYIAPLRRAVIELASRGRPWTADAMAALGGAEVGRARAYAVQLCNTGVIEEVSAGRFRVGRHFQLWQELTPNTKPGGNRKLHWKAKDMKAVH